MSVNLRRLGRRGPALLTCFCPGTRRAHWGASLQVGFRFLVAWLTVAVTLAACSLASGGTGAESDGGSGGLVVQPLVYDPPHAAPSLDGLVDTAGRPFSLGQLRGRVVLVSFGYTHCPDVCPTTLAIGREVLRIRPEVAAVVFVTVDPKRDTPAALTSYLRYFEVPIVGLSGDPATVAAVVGAWGVTAVFGEPDAAGNYPVVHSAGTYVVDPDGRLRFLYPYGTSAEALLAAVDSLVGRR